MTISAADYPYMAMVSNAAAAKAPVRGSVEGAGGEVTEHAANDLTGEKGRNGAGLMPAKMSDKVRAMATAGWRSLWSW